LDIFTAKTFEAEMKIKKIMYFCFSNLKSNDMVRFRAKIILYFVLLSLTSIFAQEPKNTITSGGWSLGIGGVSVHDEYLSPLVYTGTLFRADYESMRFISDSNNKVSLQRTLMVSGGMTDNEAKTNSIFYLALRPGIGVHYHFRPVTNLKILVGGIWDVFFASKYSFNNGNNPYSADISTQLNASAIAQYTMNIKKFQVIFRYSTRSPLAGVMFVPEYGSSYYEMFTLGKLGNALHFSSLNNSFAWNSSLSADLMFKRMILRLSYTHDYEKHHANSLHFESMQNVFSIGTVINFSTFDRGKRKAPASYNDINK
jgi:hypothetical protein